MLEPKPTASLSAGLLVRKGEARPATNPGLVLDQVEGVTPRQIRLPRPEYKPAATIEVKPAEAQGAAPAKGAAKPKAKAAPATRGQRRVAFTFRLDPERHLNLRVVAIFNRTSAQKILEEALDRYLEVAMAQDPTSKQPLAV
ncbi:MAG TPA: hypothetical protein VKZ46_04545 [Pedomonas sp.]|nr:hypothetical protein [Pedomonas sp.]